MERIYYSVIESLIFASDEPISAAEILKVIIEIDGKKEDIETSDIEKAILELNDSYKKNDNGFFILKAAGGYVYATRYENAKYIGYLSSEKSKKRLSQAAIETLAIIAYKQPITKPEIEQIRGVNCDYIINTLLEKNLIAISGRSESVGRPLLYSTTKEFLRYFGLNDLSELPKPREIEEIMQDEKFQEQKRKILMNVIEELIEEKDDNEYENEISRNYAEKISDLELIETENNDNEQIEESSKTQNEINLDNFEMGNQLT